MVRFNLNLETWINCWLLEYVYPDIAKGSDLPEDIANNCPLKAVSALNNLSKNLLKNILLTSLARRETESADHQSAQVL